MKRVIAMLVMFVGLLTISLGCDMAALTTPTPLPTATPTLAPSPTQQPTNTPLPPTPTRVPPTATATATDTPLPTPTPLPPTSTSEPTDTPEPTNTPEPTEPPAEPTEEVEPTEVVFPTSEPEPEPTEEVRATPTAEDGPPGGWSEVVRGYTGKKRVALTFDAGASGEPMPAILAALRERNIRITMFITGAYAEQYSEGVRQAAADGHEIANHTYSHLDSRDLTDEEFIEELARTETILYNLTGRSSKPYWRPPFGARNNHVLNVAVSQGYRSIYWTLDSLDSVGEPKTADFIVNRVTNTPDFNLDGAIILQHFGSQASADSLPVILDRLEEMGYTVVTISELLTP